MRRKIWLFLLISSFIFAITLFFSGRPVQASSAQSTIGIYFKNEKKQETPSYPSFPVTGEDKNLFIIFGIMIVTTSAILIHKNKTTEKENTQ